jgi:mRNA interferase HigB
LRDFWTRHPQVETPLGGWYAEVSHAEWKTPAEIKAVHRNASFLPNNRVVFNIKGNDFRLVVAVRYTQGLMSVRFGGTHAENERIDVATM